MSYCHNQMLIKINYLGSKSLTIAVLTDLTRLQSSSLTFICLGSISFSGWIRDVVGEFSLQSSFHFIGSKIFNTLSALAISSSDNVYTSFAFFSNFCSAVQPL